MGVTYAHFIMPRDNAFRPQPHHIAALIEAWTKAGFIHATRPAPVFKIDAWEAAYWREFEERALKSKNARGLMRLFRPRQPLHYSDIERPFLYPSDETSVAALASSGALIEWRANDYLKLATIYPLDLLPDPAWRPSYYLQIHLCDDFINVDVGSYTSCNALSTLCACGNDLRYEAAGIRFADYRIHTTCPVCGRPFRPQDQIVEIPIGATGEKYEERGGICYRFAIVVDCGKEIPSSDTRDPKASPAFMETCRSSLGIDLYEAGCWE